MYVEVFDITPLENFFNMIYDTAGTIEMKFTADKLVISLLNNSHVAFYNFEVLKEFFGEYIVDQVESIMIDVEDFYKILKSASKKDTLYLESNENYLICRFEHDNSRRVFELPLEEEYHTAPPLPSIEYAGVFDVLLDDLKNSCIDLDDIVKTHKFKVHTQENMLSIIAPTEAMTRYNQVINIDSDVVSDVTVDIEYIKQLDKLSKISKVVSLKMDDNKPLSWSIVSPDGFVSVSGLIAPIIEEE